MSNNSAVSKPTRIFDVDRHVYEPLSVWHDYLPAAYRQSAPTLQPVAKAWPEASRAQAAQYAHLPEPNVLCVEGQPIWADLSYEAYMQLAEAALGRGAAIQAGQTPRGHLSDMAKHGIHSGILLPTYASYLVYNENVNSHLSTAFAAAYNQWMGDFCSVSPTRLIAPFLLSRHAPHQLVQELERCLTTRFAPVVLRPNPVGGRTLSDPALEPFWNACEHHGVTVLLHEGTHARVTTAGRDRFSTRFGLHACSHIMEAMSALLSLIEGGVLERHPKLRIGLLEAGCGWVPSWLWRMDALEYPTMQAEVKDHVKMPPSDYFRRQCWVALEPGEPLVAGAAEYLGIDRLVAGSDFPHLDHDEHALQQVAGLSSQLGDAALERILWHNPRQLLGLD